MTGGSISTTTGQDMDFFSNGYGNTTLNAVASPTTANFSALIRLRENNPVITVASGSVTSGQTPGINLEISGQIADNAGTAW